VEPARLEPGAVVYRPPELQERLLHLATRRMGSSNAPGSTRRPRSGAALEREHVGEERVGGDEPERARGR
jgi:hypothetical protein